MLRLVQVTDHFYREVMHFSLPLSTRWFLFYIIYLIPPTYIVRFFVCRSPHPPTSEPYPSEPFTLAFLCQCTARAIRH